jgi:hypothetical protein
MNRQYCPEGTRKNAKKHEEEWSFLFSPLGVLAGALWAVLAAQSVSFS